MAVNPNDYVVASPEEQQQEEAKVSKYTKNPFQKRNYVSFDKYKPGTYIIRFYPAHIKSKSKLFAFSKVVASLPIQIELKKEDKIMKEIKNKQIFNQKMHGDGRVNFDLVEIFIDLVTAQIKERYIGTEDAEEKIEAALKPIVDFRKGITYKTSWVSIAELTYPDGSVDFGYFNFSPGIKGQMNKMAARSKAKKPITVDLFSHPLSGKCVQVEYNPSNKGAQIYQATLLFEQEAPANMENLELMEKTFDPLEKLFKNSFTKSDLDKQIEGLKRIDDENSFNIFEKEEFQNKVEAMLNAYPDEEDEEINEEVDTNLPTKKASKASKAEKDKDYQEQEQQLIALGKKGLIKFIEINGLNIVVKKLYTPAKIAGMVLNSLIEAEAMDELPSLIEEVNQTKSNSEEETVTKFKEKYG